MAKDWDIRFLYERHRTEMLRLAFRLLGDEEEGRDAVSDVFTQLAERETCMRCDVVPFPAALCHVPCGLSLEPQSQAQ